MPPAGARPGHTGRAHSLYGSRRLRARGERSGPPALGRYELVVAVAGSVTLRSAPT
jgi:hypothetical protein